MKGWTPRVDLAVNTTQNTTTITTRCCFFFCSGPSLSALSTCHVVCPLSPGPELGGARCYCVFAHHTPRLCFPSSTSDTTFSPGYVLPLLRSFTAWNLFPLVFRQRFFFLSFPPLLRAWTYPSPPYIAFSLPRAPLLPWCVDMYSLLLWGVFVFLGSAALVLGCRVYAMHRRVLLRTYLGS